MKQRWIYILIIILFSACAKESDWNAPEHSTDFIVVDAIFTNESRIQYITIGYNKQDLNGTAIAVSGAEIIISDEESTYILYEDSLIAGRYISDTAIAAQFDRNYDLLVLYQNKIYSAQASMAPGNTFPELIYSKNEDNGLYHIDYVASAFETDNPAMWEILIDWSFVPGYEDEDPADCRKKLLFYTLPTLDVSQVFSPAVEQVYFPAGTIIEQRRYSLTDDHASFIRTLLLETSWQGGVFPSDPANVSTNLSEGALGYFGVCAVNALSLTVE